MNVRTWIPATSLLLLAALTTAGWMWTRDPVPAAQAQAQAQTKDGIPATKQGLRRTGPVRERLVDQTPLITARGLVPLASTLEELQLARQAERLANHEVDLAFTDALRRAADAKVPDTPEFKELATLKAKAEAVVEADQQLIARLTKQLAGASESLKDALTDQLDVARAQMALDQDELDAAAEDLARAPRRGSQVPDRASEGGPRSRRP